MSSRIEYNNEHLGTIHVSLDYKKFILRMNDLGALEKLLSLKPDDEIQVDGESKNYGQFREDILMKVDTIHTTARAFLKTETEPITEEYEVC